MNRGSWGCGEVVVETRWGWRAGEREKPLNGAQLGEQQQKAKA